MADTPGEIVAGGYDRAIDRYADLETSEGDWPRMRWLRDLLARLPDGAEVLDIGCATGRPAGVQIAGRHRFTGIDISPEQIEQARRNVPSGAFVCGDATEARFAAVSFDAVVSFYSFDHIPREKHGLLLARIHEWLRPGGYLLLSIEDADQPGAVTEWLGVEMFFSMFDADTTRALVTQAGFAIINTAVERQNEADVEIPYVWVLARKPPDDTIRG